MTENKGRVINVSNRLPILIRKYAGGARVERSSGGLATALEAGWRDQPGVWIGWAGTSPGQHVERRSHRHGNASVIHGEVRHHRFEKTCLLTRFLANV